GMTVGYSAVFVATSAAALVPTLGVRCWLLHLARVAMISAWFAIWAIVAERAGEGVTGWTASLAVLIAATAPFGVAAWRWRRVGDSPAGGLPGGARASGSG